MGAIFQSGNVTPGHLVTWVTDGVVQDGGATPAAQRVLASLRGANFNITTDQPILIPLNFVAFQLTSIIVTNAPVSLTTAVGGFYPAANKGGTSIVAASQAYSALTTSASLMTATLSSFGANTRFSATNLGTINGFLAIWFALTTAQGVNATGDIYLCGIDLS
jgi:hypothetical protein